MAPRPQQCDLWGSSKVVPCGMCTAPRSKRVERKAPARGEDQSKAECSVHECLSILLKLFLPA